MGETAKIQAFEAHLTSRRRLISVHTGIVAEQLGMSFDKCMPIYDVAQYQDAVDKVEAASRQFDGALHQEFSD